MLHIAADFNFTNQTLAFSSGDTVGAEECGLIEVIDDDTVENDETFAISFMTSDPVVEFSSGLLPMTVVNITDNDSKSYILPHTILYVHALYSVFFSVVVVEWQLPGYINSEEIVSVNVCAILSQPAERNVNVMVTTASGTATGKCLMAYVL